MMRYTIIPIILNTLFLMLFNSTLKFLRFIALADYIFSIYYIDSI